MRMSVGLTGQRKHALGIVKIWDREGYLRREIRIFGDGRIAYREWNQDEIDMTLGWVDIVEPLEDRK